LRPYNSALNKDGSGTAPFASIFRRDRHTMAIYGLHGVPLPQNVLGIMSRWES
jgi:hypothetical protein